MPTVPHPIAGQRSGLPATLALASAASTAPTTAMLAAALLADDSRLRPYLGGSWIDAPAPPVLLLVVAGSLLVLAVVLLALPRWRPGAVLAASSAGLLVLLALGPVPSPLTALPRSLELARHPGLRGPALSALVLSGTVGLLALALTAALLRSAAGRRAAAARVAHGSARFADRGDLAAADLLSGEGVVLGRHGDGVRGQPLTDRSADHVLVVMPPGGGKTTGPIAGTLLNTLHPSLVIDPKGELWALTAGWRHQQGHTIVRFDPTAASTDRWNPLGEVDRDDTAVATLGVLADNLITYPAAGHGESHWTASARSLLRCLALHVLFAEDKPDLAEVRALLSPTSGFTKLFNEIAEHEHDRHGRHGWTDAGDAPTPTHPEVARLARTFASTPDRERGSIVSTLSRFLELWGDPRVARATSESDWNLARLADRQRVTVYVTVPTAAMSHLAPLLRILVALLAHRITRTEPKTGRDPGNGNRRLLLVLDEFAALGRIPILEDVMAFLRGYGVRSLLAVQDTSQLRRLYGPHHTLSAVCRLHVAAASADVSTRAEISRRLGEATHVYRKSSRTGRMLAARRTVSQAEVRRPLLTEGEIGNLPSDRLLVVKAGHPPVLAHKLPYWEQRQLKSRADHSPAERPGETGNARRDQADTGGEAA